MLEIRAEAFETGAEMPMRLTQEGPNLSPALAFSGVPPQARSLVLIADDPDAPKRVWLHWLVVNIDPAAQGFSEGLGTCPPDALAAVNDSGVRGWSGPRPPIGRHRYFFRLYALDTVLTLPENFTRAQAEAAMQGHILEEASTMGTYLLSVNR